MNHQLLLHDLYVLSIALAIGLLIGLERGWALRDMQEGKRLAGIRTFGLVGLLGGCAGLLTPLFSGVFLGLVFTGLAILFSVAYVINFKENHDISITSIVAALLTFLLSALATLGYASLAGAAAVIAATLLAIKPVLHGWVKKIEQEELYATFKLLVISVVLLTALPNTDMGPWKVFNPFEIWLMVVLVAGISYVGYFAVKIVGVRKGNVITAFFAGMTSSTALTFHFSKLAKAREDLTPYLALGILMACGLMFIRMLIYVAILKPSLMAPLLLPSLILAFLLFVPMILFYKKDSHLKAQAPAPLKNPLELKWAVSFGVILVAITFLSKLFQEEFGRFGLYGLSLLAGLVDIDAFVLSLMRMKASSLSIESLAFAAMMAALSNTAFKGVLALGVGGKQMLVRVTIPLISVFILGVVLSWWWLLFRH